MKMLKFRTKKELSGSFWGKNLKKLLSHLKSAPSNLSNESLTDTVNDP